MKKIGFLGPKGTFSYEALEIYINGKKGEYTPCAYNAIQDIIIDINNGNIDEGIVPIENSLEGAVNATLDILASDVELMIKSELVIAIRENILVKKGTSDSEIKYILSHPQPLGQCRNYILANYPMAQVKCTYSTAGAAEEVAAGNGQLAAIGSVASAQEYDLEILHRDVHDNDSNHTRFVIVSLKDSPRSGNDKSSIVFSTDNKPGSLYKILDIFNLWDINMSRIESRPAKNELGKYIFFVDIIGHKDDDDIRDALTMIKRKTSFFKFLGSYPVFEAL